MDSELTKNRWAASLPGQVLGYLLAAVGAIMWVVTEANGNGGYYVYPAGGALEVAVFVGVFTYVVAIVKPLSDKRLHPLIFGIVFFAISLLHIW